ESRGHGAAAALPRPAPGGSARQAGQYRALSSMLVFAGIVAALGTAVLYASAVALQAYEARQVPEEHTLRAALTTRLVRRPVGRREVVSVGAVAAGIALLAWAAPHREAHHSTGPRLVAALVVLGAIALAPYALSLARRAPAALVAIGAGTAYAVDGLATKFF